MSGYQKLKVSELRNSLASLNLSTEGTKPFLIERLSNAIQKNKPNSLGVLPTVFDIPEDVKRVISISGHKNLFYFHERLKHSMNIADRFTLKTGFLPDTIQTFATQYSKKNSYKIRTKNDIEEITDNFIKNLDNFQEIIFKKEHLTAYFINSQYNLQINIYIQKTPNSEASYTLSLKSANPYKYGVTKKVIFNDITFTRRNPLDVDLVDTMNAIPDLLLGVHWINQYILQNKASLIKEVDPSFRITSGESSGKMDYLSIQLNNQAIIKKYILKKLKATFKK